MKNLALGSSLLFGLGFWMVGCGDSSPCPSGEVECDGVCIPEIEPTLAGARGIQASVFNGSCAFSNCHGAEGIQQADLELSSVAVSEANLVDVESTEVDGLRVAPGDTSASYLIDKLLGVNLAPDTSRMPISSEPLCDAKIEAVEAWVADGAN
ncbi:MAG: hypothetical protein WCE62_06070 [Polyangiales bacterium]